MEIICVLTALLSLVAFVVGMFSPQTVKCKSRGKVALLYVSLFFVCILMGPQFSTHTINDTSESTTVVHSTEKAVPTSEEYLTPLEPSEPSIQKNTEIESSIGKPIEIGHFVYTINNVSFRKSVGDEYMEETADGIYLLVNLSIKNISGETRTLDGSLFAITDKSGTKYEYSNNASTALEMSGKKTLFLKECQPRITTKGVLIFEVPQKDEYYLHLVGSFGGTQSVQVLLK